MLLFLYLFEFLSVAAIIFAFVMAVKTFKKSKAQSKSMAKSRTFSEISTVIFSEDRPSQICITKNNEIFYGPIQGTYRQVSGNLIPPMDHLQRYSLGKTFAEQYGYKSDTCFGPQGQNLGLCQTGNNYLDMNTDILVTGSVATGNWQ